MLRCLSTTKSTDVVNVYSACGMDSVSSVVFLRASVVLKECWCVEVEMDLSCLESLLRGGAKVRYAFPSITLWMTMNVAFAVQIINQWMVYVLRYRK